MTEEEFKKLIESIEGNQCGDTLNLRMKSINALQAKRLAVALSKNTSVKNLDLWHNQIGPQGASALAKMLVTNVTLNTLYLRNNQIGYQGARAIASALYKNKTLRCLDLGENEIRDLGAQLLADALSKNATLQSLVLWKNSIGRLGISAIAEMLKKNKTLDTLNLSSNKIGKLELELLLTGLADNSSLLSLSLGSNQFGNAGVLILSSFLSNPKTKLQSLDLGNNQISDESIHAIAQALISNKTLQSLDLYRNLISETGAKTLVEALLKNSILQSLDLYKNKLGIQGAESIASVLSKNQILQFLDVSGMSEEGGKIQANIDKILKLRRDQLKATHHKGCEEVMRGLGVLISSNQKAGLMNKKTFCEKYHPFKVNGQKHLACLKYLLQEDHGYLDLYKRWQSIISQAEELLKKMEPPSEPSSLVSSVQNIEDQTTIRGDDNEHYRQEIERLMEQIKKLEKDEEQDLSNENTKDESKKTEEQRTIIEHKQLVEKTTSKGASYKIDYKELEFNETLGKGSFGTVYHGSYLHTDVAIKVLNKRRYSAEAKAEFEKETEIMARLRSGSIVQFFGCCLDPYCIVMEYMPRGSLHKILHSKQDLSWEIRIKIAIDIACGLNFLHHEDILHRDVKSSNVLVNNEFGAKLSDFGLSKIKTETMKSGSKAVGTLAWMAPELAKGPCTKASDVFSLGVTLGEIASREKPFKALKGKNRLSIPLLIMKGERDEIPKDCPPKLASLILSCESGNPEQRPTANEVVLYLKSDKDKLEHFLPRFNTYRQDSQHSLLGNTQASTSNKTSDKGFQSNLHSNEGKVNSTNSGFQSNLNSQKH